MEYIEFVWILTSRKKNATSNVESGKQAENQEKVDTNKWTQYKCIRRWHDIRVACIEAE